MSKAQAETMRRPIWRLMVPIMVCLLLGLLLTTLVAAGALLYSPTTITQDHGGISTDLLRTEQPGPGVKKGQLYSGFGVRVWMHYAYWIGSSRRGVGGHGVQTMCCGWPFPAFASKRPPEFSNGCSYQEFDRIVSAAMNGAQTGDILPKFLGAQPFRPVPVTALAAGLAADTVLFAILAGAVLYLPHGVRLWRRRRAGKCVYCGYPLTGASPCPECGHMAHGADRSVPA